MPPPMPRVRGFRPQPAAPGLFAHAHRPPAISLRGVLAQAGWLPGDGHHSLALADKLELALGQKNQEQDGHLARADLSL